MLLHLCIAAEICYLLAFADLVGYLHLMLLMPFSIVLLVNIDFLKYLKAISVSPDSVMFLLSCDSTIVDSSL